MPKVSYAQRRRLRRVKCLKCLNSISLPRVLCDPCLPRRWEPSYWGERNISYNKLGSLVSNSDWTATVIPPDILDNAGGVVISYSECVQNQQKLFWDEEAINKQLHQILNRTFHEVYGIAKIITINSKQMKQTKSFPLMTPIQGRAPGDGFSIRLEQRHWNFMKKRLDVRHRRSQIISWYNFIQIDLKFASCYTSIIWVYCRK